VSRRIANRGLADLCAKHERSVGDVAYYCKVKPRSIGYYIAGRPSPRLEKRMSELFGLSVSKLRRKLKVRTTTNDSIR